MYVKLFGTSFEIPAHVRVNRLRYAAIHAKAGFFDKRLGVDLIAEAVDAYCRSVLRDFCLLACRSPHDPKITAAETVTDNTIVELVVENSGIGLYASEIVDGSCVHNHVCLVVVRLTSAPASARYAPPPRYWTLEFVHVEFPYVTRAFVGA